jgi:hypothetical protein
MALLKKGMRRGDRLHVWNKWKAGIRHTLEPPWLLAHVFFTAFHLGWKVVEGLQLANALDA